MFLKWFPSKVSTDPVIPPLGYRLWLYLVMVLETLGFLLVGFGLVSEQVAQVRHELDDIRKKVQ